MITLSSCAAGESGDDQLGLDVLDWPDQLRWSPSHAHSLTLHLLRGLPDRTAHSLRAGLQAWRVRTTVPVADADLLVSAALLHDIGYAPALRQTGFHPIDGANFLLRLGAPTRLAALVAHHSESHLLAAAHGLRPELSRFHREEGLVADALAYADMTAGPRGAPMSVRDRLADIAARHAHEDPELVAARQARVPLLLAATERVHLHAPTTAGKTTTPRPASTGALRVVRRWRHHETCGRPWPPWSCCNSPRPGVHRATSVAQVTSLNITATRPTSAGRVPVGQSKGTCTWTYR